MRDLPIPLRLKQARLRSGITQETLGVQAGIDEYSASARMNQYEKGVHLPNFELLERCAEVLEVPVEYFYARSDETAALLLSFHQMTNEQKRMLLEHVNKITDLNSAKSPA